MKSNAKLSPLLTFNPELQRNIWLELSTGRVLGMVLVIALMSGAVYEFFGASYVAGLLNGVLSILVIVWGPLLAADSVFDEVLGRTWDVQRLSGQRAAGLVLGKLAGSTIYVWFGALLCLAGTIAVAHDQAHRLYDHVLEGVMAQSMAMLAAMVIMRFGNGGRRAGRLGAWIIGIIFAGCFSVLIEKIRGKADFSDLATTQWYGMSFSGVKFWYVSEIFLVAWIVFGMIRLMRRELGYREGPIGWALFTAYAMIFAGGLLTPAAIESDATHSGQGHAFLAAHALTYIALLCLPVAAANSRKMAIALSHKAWPIVWTEMPSWMPAFGLMLVGALLFASTGSAHALWAVALLGFFCRDIVVVYGFRTRFARRSETALVVYFALVYLFASFVITLGYKAVTGGTQGILLEVFSPPTENASAIGVIFPWAEALLAYVLFRKDFTKLYRPLSD